MSAASASDLPEGMASLDNAIFRESPTARAVIQDGRKAALISFDVTADGFRPVPRAHLGLIAGGLAMSLESDVPQGADRPVGLLADVVCGPRFVAGGMAAVGRQRWCCTIRSTRRRWNSRSTSRPAIR